MLEIWKLFSVVVVAAADGMCFLQGMSYPYFDNEISVQWL